MPFKGAARGLWAEGSRGGRSWTDRLRGDRYGLGTCQERTTGLGQSAKRPGAWSWLYGARRQGPSASEPQFSPPTPLRVKGIFNTRSHLSHKPGNFSMFGLNHQKLLSGRSQIVRYWQPHLMQFQNNYSRTWPLRGSPGTVLSTSGCGSTPWHIRTSTASTPTCLPYEAPSCSPAPVTRLRYKEV